MNRKRDEYLETSSQGQPDHSEENDFFESKNDKFNVERKGTNTVIKGFLIVLGIFLAGCIVFMVVWHSAHDTSNKKKETILGTEEHHLKPLHLKQLPKPSIAEATVKSKGQDKSQAPKHSDHDAMIETIMADRLGSGLRSTDSSSTIDTINPLKNGNYKNLVKSKDDVNAASSALATRLNTGEIALSKATYISPEKQNFMISSGTMIPCGTLEEINTTQPGFISCQVSRDVYSMNNAVRLIDKGSRVDGEVAQGVALGQNRVFVNWIRLTEPDGVRINLFSGAAGPLGAPGIKGYVETHWWAKFGNAMMISVFTDAGQTIMQVLTNMASKRGTTSVNTGNTTSSSQDMAQQVLEQSLRIQPVLKAFQGKGVMIYVARDLDFSDVFHLEAAP